MTLLAPLLAALALAAPPEPKLDLGQGLSATFADATAGAAALRTEDSFVRALTPFDRAARVRVEGTVDTRRFLEFAGKQAQNWSPAERTAVGRALKEAAGRFSGLKLQLPSELLVVKSSGREESGSIHTRGVATLVVPAGRMAALTWTELVPPLFHLALRNTPALRDELYALVGFRPCARIALPEDLRDRRITNPDAPEVVHCIELELGGKKHQFQPTLFASADYAPRAAADLFDYLQFKLLAVSKSPKGWEVTRNQEGKYVLVPPEYVPSFLEKVGRNSPRPMHPEIILADNLATALSGQAAPDPAIPAALLKALRRAEQ